MKVLTAETEAYIYSTTWSVGFETCVIFTENGHYI